MAEYTDFGLAVKAKLLGPPVRTQAWLAAEVRRATGLYVDAAYLSKILTGRRRAPRIAGAICEILGMCEPPAQAEPAEERGGEAKAAARG